MNIILFDNNRSDFYPLIAYKINLLTFEFGILTIKEKWEALF